MGQDIAAGLGGQGLHVGLILIQSQGLGLKLTVVHHADFVGSIRSFSRLIAALKLLPLGLLFGQTCLPLGQVIPGLLSHRALALAVVALQVDLYRVAGTQGWGLGQQGR